MFKEMRRKDRALEKNEALEILKNCDYGILSTIDKNGYPYGVPLSYVYLNDSLYFHSATEGNKLDNILTNDKVSFCAVGQTSILPNQFSTKYESVIAFGKAAEVIGDEKKEALLELLNKYSPEFIEQGKVYIQNAGVITKVIKISIDHITGKARR